MQEAVRNLADLLSDYKNSKLFKKLPHCINYNKKFTLFQGYSRERGEGKEGEPERGNREKMEKYGEGEGERQEGK